MVRGNDDGASTPMVGFPVVVHVYDLSDANKYLRCVGLGFYHTGVEVQGREYTFTEEGVIAHPPRAVARFRQSIVLGRMESNQEISACVRVLREEFRPVRRSVDGVPERLGGKKRSHGLPQARMRTALLPRFFAVLHTRASQSRAMTALL